MSVAAPSIGRFLAEVVDAPLAAPLECGLPSCLMGGERTPDGYRVGDNLAPVYKSALPNRYETMSQLSQKTVPYIPGTPETYDNPVAGSERTAILASSFPAWDKKIALHHLAEEERHSTPSGYKADARSNYDVLQEAEEVAARAAGDPLGIGTTRKYDLSRDNVTLTNNPEFDAYLNGVLKDTKPFQEAGEYFGTGFSEGDRKITFFVDKKLRGTPTLAYVVDIPDIKESYPAEGRELEMAYGPNPLMALNPQVIEAMNPHMTVAYTRGTADEQLRAVLGHEKTHLKQKGKTAAKSVTYPVLVHLGRHIATGEDIYRAVEIPAGEAFVEGGVEVAMKARGLKPPTDYFPPHALYNQYRNLVERVEERTPGFTEQFLRTARKKGARAAAAFMGRMAGDSIVEYLRELNPEVEILKFPEEAGLYPIAA